MFWEPQKLLYLPEYGLRIFVEVFAFQNEQAVPKDFEKRLKLFSVESSREVGEAAVVYRGSIYGTFPDRLRKPFLFSHESLLKGECLLILPELLAVL